MRISDWSSDVGSSDLRAKQLVSRGFISQADIDSKTATRDAAVARVNVAKASLAETQARNGRLDIRAPAAGLVLTRDVEPGQIGSAGSGEIGRAHVCTPVPHAHLVCRLLLEKNKTLNMTHPQ